MVFNVPSSNFGSPTLQRRQVATKTLLRLADRVRVIACVPNPLVPVERKVYRAERQDRRSLLNLVPYQDSAPLRSPILNPSQPPRSYFNKQALPSIEEDADTAMAARATLSPEQRRLLKITGRMPLASVSDLAPVMDVSENRVRRMLAARSPVERGMTGRPRRRWFLSSRAVAALYVTDHRHPGPREEARAARIARLHPEGGLPADFTRRFALDHHHRAHLEDQDATPFSGADRQAEDESGHEHPPWTATSRGVQASLRRLAMLEPLLRPGPGTAVQRSGYKTPTRRGDHRRSADDRLPAAA